jgi:hypothetical protein
VTMPGYAPSTPLQDAHNTLVQTAGYSLQDVAPLQWFLEPSIVAINELEARGLVAPGVVGLSGGGWTTIVVAALDRRVAKAFPMAGYTPRCMWQSPWQFDFEQAHPIWDYQQLTYLAADSHRSVHAFYNDPDVYFNPHERAALFQRWADTTRPAGDFRLTILHHDQGHVFVPEGILTMERELAGKHP